jgi:hypothetical protein
MKFWQIATALLMWKLLELFWSYALVTNGDVGPPLILATIVWFLVSGMLWALVRAVAASIAANRELGDESRDL